MNHTLPDYYEENISLLKKHHPQVWEIMTRQDVAPRGEIFLSADGKPNLRVVDAEGRTALLHGKADPEEEVPQFLAMVPENSTGVIALIGMGLGYTPVALLGQRPNIRHLAVFESDPGIFAQALRHVDLSTMLSDSRLLLSVGADPVAANVFAPAARALQLEQIHMLQHMPSFMLDDAAYQNLYDLAFGYANQLNVGGATTFRFGYEFINNRFTHLSSIHHNSLLERLQGKFSGVPAIMVAGGPSLDKNIHLLEEAKDKAVIIAVDTVLPVLLNRGIVPDFVTSIDPQEMTYEKFADVVPKVKGMPFLICSAWIHPKVPKLFPADQVFWSFYGNHIERWFNSLMGGTIITGGAGTVAHMNMIAAVIMGCSPIVFIGQDLAFSDDKDHAGGVVLTNRKEVEKIMKSPDSMLVDGVFGEKVMTSRAFLGLKMTFESMIRSNPGHYINATEGGANIEGTEVMPLQEVLDTYCTDIHDIDARVKKSALDAELIDSTPLLDEFQSVLKTLKRLRKNIKKADDFSRSVQKKLEKFGNARGRYRSYDALPDSVKHQISEIDSCHSKIDKENKIWQLLEDITMEGLRQSERMLHEASLIKDDPGRYVEWLSLSMKRLDLINRVRTGVLDVFEQNIVRTLDYHRKEKTLIGEIDASGGGPRNVLELARAYFETGNYVLARRLLEGDAFDGAGSDKSYIAERKFLLGAIAAYQTDYERSELYFEQALSADTELAKRIDEFRHKMGDIYSGYAQSHVASDRSTSVVMFLKGFRYCAEHDVIRERLSAIFSEEMEEAGKHVESGRFEDAEPVILFWRDRMAETPDVAAVFDVGRMADFHRYHGTLQAFKKDLSGALESFGNALNYTPDNPDIHISMTEILFAQNEFDKGIGHLNTAVSLDRKYAGYWENIGDNLQEAGQPGDAVTAYEQCFTALPEHIIVLKKIGDCYRLMEQYEAAAEAYRQFRSLSEKQA